MNRLRCLMGTLLFGVMLAGCAAPPSLPMSPFDVPQALQALPPARLLLLGEQHDADAHQALAQHTVQQLAAEGRLAALVLEMAERGTHTRGLAREATEAEVQARLQWNDDGWPWGRYGPTVMAAVRAGVPVLGGNQPRTDMRAAMADATLDAALTPTALARQREHIDLGHCKLLPASQLAPMARIQIARDRDLAQTLVEAAAGRGSGQMVVLVAGAEHVRRGLGVPAHLGHAWADQTQAVLMHSGPLSPGASEGFDRVWQTAPTPARDHCTDLRQRLKR